MVSESGAVALWSIDYCVKLLLFSTVRLAKQQGSPHCLFYLLIYLAAFVMSGNFPSVVERGLFFIDNPFKQNMYYSVMIGIVSIASMLNMSNVNTYSILSDLYKCVWSRGIRA